jgi:hypothetical protein
MPLQTAGAPNGRYSRAYHVVGVLTVMGLQDRTACVARIFIRTSLYHERSLVPRGMREATGRMSWVGEGISAGFTTPC